MKQASLSEFTNLYPVSKTLRFELKPVGRTLDWIEKKELLEQDEHRAASYKVVKRLIDHYHKHFIEEGLRKMQGMKRDVFVEELKEYRSLMGKTDAALKKKMEKVQDKLRKDVKSLFDTNRLFGKELIKEDLMAYLYECERNGELLPDGMTIDECKSVVSEFNDFTTYFTGFYDNRENMYSEEAKSTAIAFRLIHENLPKYIANMEVWTKIRGKLATQLMELEKAMTFELRGKPISCFFEELESYADTLAQSDIDRYNTLIGGRSEGDTKVQGINEYINLYNQKADKKDRLPKMVELYKMILSDRGTLSWLPESFSKDNELLEAVAKSYNEIHNIVFEGDDEAVSLKELLVMIEDYDVKGIYIKNDTTLTSVVKQAYGEWDAMEKGLRKAYDDEHPLKDSKKQEKHEESRKKWMNSFDSFSLDDICHYTGSDAVLKWYEGLWCKVKDSADATNQDDAKSAFEKVEYAYAAAANLLNTEYRGNLKENTPSIEKPKTLLDALKDLQRLAFTLKGSGDESDRDGRFYSEWERIMETLNQVTPLYNMVRNYVTQKPYSEEKFKLNFENPTLLTGWPNPQNTSGVLFIQNNQFYLGIMPQGGRLSVETFKKMIPSDVDDKITFVRYQQGGDMGKNVQNLMVIDGKTVKKNGRKNKNGENVLLEKLKCQYLPSEINRIRQSGEYSTLSPFFNKDSLIKFIDYYKDRVQEYYSDYNFTFKESCEYDNFGDFTNHINEQSYTLSFIEISLKAISQLVEQGKLYLFQIYNKDFSEFSKGTPNMHTLYWKALFSEENLKDVVYKLNGQAEVFFRRKSITYDEKHEKEGFHHEELKNKFDYPIYKDRRYSMDKFQFHVPITINFKSTRAKCINGKYVIEDIVQEYIKLGGVEHIIGIDRGERHLLYLSMIDLKGNIVKQYTLNEIVNEYKGRTYRTDYHALLDKKEEDRDAARKNWKTIEGIKDLKEGYLSQVVHIISQLMVEYKAIVVLEDLNFGFMRGRQKVEKQVYQKFEKMLIDKLNYLVDKQRPVDETGGVLHALQLTSQFDSFQKLGKQSGFLFYVPASLTSKIDPVTGFANYINTKYENREKARELLGKFADIRYNAVQDYFEFVIDKYTEFNPKAAGRQQWIVCSFGPRIKTFRNPAKNNEWDNVEVKPTEELKRLFEKNEIDYKSNLLAQIRSKDDAQFYEELLRLLGLVLQMRNSVTGTTTDYIISPVADENGIFYCSTNGDEALPKDADANGAYNIARKGLWAVMQMQQADNPKDVKLAMSNEEWMQFAQQKPYKK